MGLLSWLLGSKKESNNKNHTIKAKAPTCTFDLKVLDNHKSLKKIKDSNCGIKKVKLIVDKQDPDTCFAVKKMKKIHLLAEAPSIPLNKEKCKHCVCYYEAIIPKD